MFLSLSVQVLLNVEALNMVESVGNYTRHRRAPVVLEVKEKERGTKFIIRYVPAISGESLAHAYQELLASIAKRKGLPVCGMCVQGVFTKHADENMFAKEPWESVFKNAASKRDFHKAEKVVIENCVVEDVGGFLYTGKNNPVKRTSRIQFSYALPVLDALKEGAAATEPQFHVRHVPTMPEQRAQMIYYVETGSALYTFSVALDVDGVGVTSLVKREEVGDRGKRVKAALEALTVLICNAAFGAKRSRFTPAWKVVSIAAALSHPMPFTVSPGHSYNYIEETCKRAVRYAEILKDLNEEVKVYYYAGSEKVRPSSEVTGKAGAIECESPEDVMKKITEAVEKRLSKP